MPRKAEALPMTRIRPLRRAVIAGSTARNSRGSGSTSAAKVSRHSSSVTSAAGVVGAGTPRLASRMSIGPAAATAAAGASGWTSGSVLAITVAPCRAKTSHRTGPMKTSAWVIRTRWPARRWSDMVGGS